MRKRIFRNYFILIAVILIITVLFCSKIAINVYQNEVESKLKSIAYLIEYSILSNNDKDKINFEIYAKEISKSQNIYDLENKASTNYDTILRVTFVDLSGNVLGDSEADFHTMENHSQRKEIQEAVRGSVGKDIRKSKTLSEDLLYIAVLVKNMKIIARVSISLMEIKKINQKIFLYGIFAILFGGILTAFISLRISKSLTLPLEKIIAVANEISTGNYSNRIDLNQNDELLLFANSFNNMAFELEKYLSDLQSKKDEIESIVDSMTNAIIAIDTNKNIIFLNPVASELFKIEDSKEVIGKNILKSIRNHQLNQALVETLENNSHQEIEILLKEDILLKVDTSPIKTKNIEVINAGSIAYIQDVSKIRKLEQMRTEFVSNVTHELKTPLTSIRGFIDTLKNGSINDPKRAMRFLDIIDIESERLNSLISDILELSEIEFKKIDSDITKVDLKELTDEVFEISHGIAEGKRIKLINSIENKVFILANRNRMKQMLLNLINNAIKYNYENGSVSISGYKAPGKIVIKVKDTGIGIDKDLISRIFERFYRVDKGRTRDVGGTGLGLSIVKHIIQLYNGDISLKSEVEKGSEFIIQIPQKD